MTALTDLALCAGIEPAVRDYFGNERTASIDALRAILSAMNIDTQDDAAIDRALRDCNDRPWKELLAPAIVVREGETGFACSAPAFDGDVLWRLTLESGEEFGGSIRWTACRLQDSHSIDGAAYERRAVQLEVDAPLGYHRVLVEVAGRRCEAAFIVVPPRAYSGPQLDRGLWALAVQLYALRSSRNAGMGDFSDLAVCARAAASAGAAAVALNPLHALYLTNPAAASPYSASSRLFLNALYLDVEAVAEFPECETAQKIVASPGYRSAAERLRSEPLVDYVQTARLKLPILRHLWQSFLKNHLERDDERAQTFARFRRSGGEALTNFARYEAIASFLAGGTEQHVPWTQWPPELRDPRSEAVAKFARENAASVAESMYRQWQCEEQLAVARAAAPLAIGVYLDLAVGIDTGGADAWADPGAFARGASLGAPPDPLNTGGQNWGLAPFEPHALREREYAPFIAMVRSNMRRAGALRIDHVMSLMRAYWIAPGLDATQGAYVRYPFDDLRGIVALESVRNRCVVVGEDLGTVPDGFRQTLSDSGMLGCRLLIFEREGERFRSPEEYTRTAVASVATHDLPPLALWWQEADPQTRSALLAALRAAGIVVDADPLPAQLANAVHRFLAQTSAQLVAVQIEDVFEETARTNVPGTVDEQPNWRRKRAVPLDRLAADPRFEALSAIFSARNGRTAAPAAK